MRPLELRSFGRIIWRGSRERRVLIQAGSNGGHDQGVASREETGTSILLQHFKYGKTFPIYFSPIFFFFFFYEFFGWGIVALQVPRWLSE